jgi:hypothetical protein
MSRPPRATVSRATRSEELPSTVVTVEPLTAMTMPTWSFVVAAAQILHEGVSGDYHLRGPIRLKAAHRFQPVLELTVIGFDRFVRVLLDVVPRGGNQLSEHAGVDRRGVGDHFVRDDLQRVQRSGEEPARRCGVSTGRDQHVDDLAVLVDRSVDVAPHAVDLH